MPKPVNGKTQPTQPVAVARNGALKCFRQTLGTTVQVTSISIPSFAQGVRFYPNTTAITYALDEAPVLITTSAYGTGTINGTTASGVGGQAVPTQWYEIYFEDGVNGGGTRPTTLQMLPATNSSTVDIVWF